LKSGRANERRITVATRLYEVPAEATVKGQTEKKVYLVEASSRAAAEKHVADKFVSEAVLATPKRVSELMGAGVKPELVEEK